MVRVIIGRCAKVFSLAYRAWGREGKKEYRVVILSGVLCREGPMQLAGSAYILRAKYGLRMTRRCGGTREIVTCYSYLSASIGFSREAFRAGKKPDTIPTIDRITNEMIMTLIEACRKMAPSWSVVL